jgi:hypothetical protein
VAGVVAGGVAACCAGIGSRRALMSPVSGGRLALNSLSGTIGALASGVAV